MKMLQMCEVHPWIYMYLKSCVQYYDTCVVYRKQVHHDVYMYLTRCAVE